MQRTLPIRRAPSNEDLFFEHYAQLSKWAAQLCSADPGDAEDLVQDFYLQVTRINVALSEVDELEPYLFKILRNLHYSRMRRRIRSAQHEISIVDFDSLVQGLAAVDRNDLIFVRANLALICQYACKRKNESRAACVFILRFFLGYYPSEVMKITRMSRMGVDRAVQVARGEARLYLENPNSERPHFHDARPSVDSQNRSSSSYELLFDLRRRIFKSCDGPCFHQSTLAQVCSPESDARFTIAELAHLVTCRECLDRVNAILGLPLLDERSPDDSIGRDNRPGSGSGGASRLTVTRGRKVNAEAKQRRALERKRRECFEHRPASLELCINGDSRATQRVTAEVSELKLTLNRNEEPSFIEVFSEQGVRLAYLHVAEPTQFPDLQQHECIALSDGRSLNLALSFAGDLTSVRVVYQDPVFSDSADGEELDESGCADQHRIEPIAARRTRMGKMLVKLFEFWKLPRNAVSLRMNPLLTSAMLLGVCSIVCFVLWTRSGPRVSAKSLLDRAEQSDAAVVRSARSEVVYQKVRIVGSGRSLERAIYRDPQKRRRPKRQHLNPGDQPLQDAMDRAGVNWDEPLSTANFAQWRDGLRTKQDVVSRTGKNLLTLTTSAGVGGPVSRESLTVRESDFHPVERTIELRSSETIEIAELNYDVMPWGAVNQDWFEPMALVSDTAPLVIHPVPRPHRSLSELELATAELAVRTVLNELHADTGEPIHLTRENTGIEIKGVVETNTRKREVLLGLRSLPHVKASILSAEELAAGQSSNPALENQQRIDVNSVEARPSPLETYLRQRSVSVDQLSILSHELLNGALKVSQAGVHLSELQPGLQYDNALPPAQQSQLASLTKSYEETIAAGLSANRRSLSLAGLDVHEEAASSPQSTHNQSLDTLLHSYRQLTLELISNQTEQSRSAPLIASEIIATGECIRLRIAER